jgi:hypothetical protein
MDLKYIGMDAHKDVPARAKFPAPWTRKRRTQNFGDMCCSRSSSTTFMDQNQTSGELRVLPDEKHQCDAVSACECVQVTGR